MASEGNATLATLASLEQSKDELLAALANNQKELISTYKSLKKQVSGLSQNLNNGAGISVEEQQEAKELNAQLQRASKVKSKGIW